VAQQIDELLEARLIRSCLGAEHAHVRDGEGAVQPDEDRQKLLG
jgi:hypothetical protein